MAKWADYLISAVRFGETGGHKYISHVLLHVDNGESIGGKTLKTKDEILNLLDNGENVKTMRWSYPSWFEGAKVQPYTHGNMRYLRTHPDASVADNLDNMPPLA